MSENNDEVEEVDPIEVELEIREKMIKEKPLSFFLPSKEKLEYTWEHEFTEKVEPLLGSISVVEPGQLLDIMMHHVNVDVFSKEYIEKHPECVMNQIEKYRENEIQGTKEEVKEVKKKTYKSKKFDWNNKKYVGVL
jgi:hypothetical protein